MRGERSSQRRDISTRVERAVVEIDPAPGMDSELLVAMAAAVERGSEHPLARAILKRAKGQPVLEVRGFDALSGYGKIAQLDRQTILVGNLGLMGTRQVALNGLKEQA